MDVASPPPDAARDRPGSLGGQYEKLLATVGHLQGDLQRTVGVCQVWFTSSTAGACHLASGTSIIAAVGRFSKMVGQRHEKTGRRISAVAVCTNMRASPSWHEQ